MTSDRVARHFKRQKLKSAIEQSTSMVVAPREDLVQQFLHSNTSAFHETFRDVQDQWWDIESGVGENPIELLERFREQFDNQKFTNLIQACKATVLDSTIKPFGLSRALFKDKDGGDVTTLHNAKEGVFASEADRQRFKKVKFDRDDYVKQHLMNKKRKVLFQQNKTIIDAYTGKRLTKDGSTELDHVVSAKEIHESDDIRFFMNAKERVELVNSDENLRPTSKSINASKGEKRMQEWMDGQASDQPRTNKEKYGITDTALKHDRDARRYIRRKVRGKKIKKYTTETVRTGVSAAAKMGIQQAIGLMLREFIVAIFDEIQDIYRNGFKGGKLDSSFFVVLKERLFRIATKVMGKWREVLDASWTGAISGFFSNIVTTIINAFITTQKRFVRMIREGVFSLFSALRMLLFPPDDLTFEQAAHEATKIVGAGVAVSLGLMLEHHLASLEILGEGMIGVISSLVTGLATVLVVYLIDKIDLFGVSADERHGYVMQKLESLISNTVQEADKMFPTFEHPTLLHTPDA